MRSTLMLTWTCLTMSISCTVAHEYLGSIPEGSEQPGSLAGGGAGLRITIQGGTAGTGGRPAESLTAGFGGQGGAGGYGSHGGAGGS